MSNKRIKYFSFYGCSQTERLRINSPAADTKVDYIIDVLNRIGYAVDQVSLASSSSKKFLSGYVEKKGINTLKYFSSLGNSTYFMRLVNIIYLKVQFLLWCIINIKKDEQVIIYHSLGYDDVFVLLKRIKKFIIVGDIEEIYQDVSKQRDYFERNEYKFINLCDKYLFPNTILNHSLNTQAKPYVVCHGIYKVNDTTQVSNNRNQVHLLYSGTFDPNKGGALAAVKAAVYLNEKYHLHISGFGSYEYELLVKKEIERVRSLTSCEITYHGYLDEDNFKQLMHECAVGLCTQDPSSQLNMTSFPSKILNYMANGLIVVTGRNKAIEESAVGDIVSYYNEQDPKAIADAIENACAINRSTGRERLINLDLLMCNNLSTLLR